MRLQRAVETRTSSGQVEQAWVDLEQRWRAGVEPVSLRNAERTVGSQLLEDITHVVRMRHRPGLRAKDRVVYSEDGTDRTLEIASIADIGNRHWMDELLCKEVP